MVDENLTILMNTVGQQTLNSNENTETGEVSGEDAHVCQNDESFVPGEGQSETETLEEITLKQRSKNNKNAMHVWGQIINKNKREKGVTHKGKKKQHDRWSYDMPRPARFMSDPCNCKRGKSIPSKLKCGTITHERRQKIFHSFWTKMTWAEKKCM
nr:unnamed protein product [Callosobruchus analis]